MDLKKAGYEIKFSSLTKQSSLFADPFTLINLVCIRVCKKSTSGNTQVTSFTCHIASTLKKIEHYIPPSSKILDVT